MRPSPLFRLCLVLIVCGCSLSLENPEVDAKNKVAKPVPTTVEALIGRWRADSTYTVDDTRALIVKQDPVWMEIFPDSSFSQLDTSRLTFNGKSDGVYLQSGDTLITYPSDAPPDTFLVQLTFLGNYLRLHHPSDQRYTFFHKVKPADSAVQTGMLRDSLWRMVGRRLEPGVFTTEANTVDFSYLRFSGDSMYAEVRANGVATMDSGILSRKDFNWTWKAASGKPGIPGGPGQRGFPAPMAAHRRAPGFRLFRLHPHFASAQVRCGHAAPARPLALRQHSLPHRTRGKPLWPVLRLDPDPGS